jgi:EAL domain-containing protein (putative c-di-GMP-specific phosphodiesterase class I)
LHRPDDTDLASREGEMSWVSRINQAIAEDRLYLVRQHILPVATAESRQHWEVLVRMRDPGGRVIGPGEFLPAAERYGLMPRIDRWVIETLFRRLAALDDSEALPLVAVNVSGNSVSDPEFNDFVIEAFKTTGAPPKAVCFEITETATITHMSQATRFIRQMRALGASIALDDFGSGMSSFGYLKMLDIDYLKIDGIFIRDLLTNPVDAAMVEAIQRVARVLGIQTVAEFVETVETAERLRELQIDFGQGLALQRPEIWSD